MDVTDDRGRANESTFILFVNRAEKAGGMLKWWYADWIFIGIEAIGGRLMRPTVVTSLLFFVVGAVGIIINTAKMLIGMFK